MVGFSLGKHQQKQKSPYSLCRRGKSLLGCFESFRGEIQPIFTGMLKPRKPDLTFTLLLLLVSVVFIWQRPLNSPWNPFIAGDGHGYYAHLPAVFIQHDEDLSFRWFNEVHNRNYAYSAFENPEDVILVQYGDRKINKYYPGLSFTWMPFFLGGHIAAKMFGYAADGYTLPYQLAMGIASLFWLLVGLIYLRKLIRGITGNETAAVWVPLLIFFGTNLYMYAIFNNTLSHSYSFTFNTIVLYYLYAYFTFPEKRTQYFCLLLLALAVTVSVRPLNGLVLIMGFAFLPKGFFREHKYFSGWNNRCLVSLGTLLLLLIWHFSIMYVQTGKLFAYTYTNERFYFGDAHFAGALFSYHNGLFLYVPLALLAFAGIAFLKGKQRIIVPLFFLAVTFLYSAWWYWPITRRTLIDYYPLLAIMLGALLAGTAHRKIRYAIVALIVMSVAHYQLKNYQVNKGILSEYYTYGDLYWRNYFRTDPANIYPVPPQTIIASAEHTRDFEADDQTCPVTDSISFSGKQAIRFDEKWASCILTRDPYPALFSETGWKKVRVSYETYCEDSVGIVSMYLEFRKHDSVIVSVPFYLVRDFINPGKWDYKEFGYEIIDSTLINPQTVDEVTFGMWNSEPKGKVFVDDVRIEFLLTDRSFETIQ